MSEWRQSTLGEFVSLQRGHDLTATEQKPGIIPVMGSAGHNGYHNTALAKGPGIVIGRSGASFGQVHYCSVDYWPHNTTLYVTDFHGNDPHFSFYFLKNINFARYNSGSAQPSLNRNFIYPIEVKIPDVEEQRAIAHILGTLDDKIELNRRMNETLEAIARALFQSWFVDFDPVRARMNGEPPESICQRLRLTPDLLALFPDRLVDSELGDGSTSLTTGIPEGWRFGTIGDHCYLNAESWTAKTIPGVVHYVDLANVKNGVISEVQILPSAITPSRARRILRAGDTIIGTVRPGNRSFALIGEDEPQLTGSTGFAVLSPKRKALREMVFFLATSDENIDRLSRLADGAAYPAVRPEVVTAGVCIVPDPRVIDAFHAATASMTDYRIANRVNSDALAAVRDTLLPKLLSGELRVPDAEEALEAK